MKKKKFSFVFLLLLLFSVWIVPVHSHAADSVDMFRLYNPNTGEHFYEIAENTRYFSRVDESASVVG